MAPCNPPLNFVQNGPAGSAFPAPLDPTDVPATDTNPGFGDLASSFLDALDPATDGSDQLESDAAAAVDLLDTIGAGLDATLDTILLLLDQAQPQPVNDALAAFASAQPGAEGFVGDVAGVAVPALGQVPIIGPGGSTVITPGAPPEQGGVAPTGGAAYVLRYPVPYVLGAPHAIDTSRLTGPNPPFAALQGYELGTDAAGRRQVYALIEINPAQAGTFNGTITAQVAITVTGAGGVVDVTVPVTVVVQG